MSETQTFNITLTQENNYAFTVFFDDTDIPTLHTDESAPLGKDSGPNPARLLVAAVANCLSASLLFALRKFKNDPGAIVTHAKTTIGRNDKGRWRIEDIDVAIELPGEAVAYERLERLLSQFEDFCIVTESVRCGVAVNVAVRDSRGAVLHDSRKK